LDTVDAVDAVKEENKNEDECDLLTVSTIDPNTPENLLTFIPYCSFATSGLSEIKLNILRLTAKGIGMTRAMNSAISDTRMAKT
jgi:hypothetical protein